MKKIKMPKSGSMMNVLGLNSSSEVVIEEI